MKNSKVNLARRQEKLEARLDRRWQPEREQPVFESGNIHYEVSGRISATSWGGIGLIQTLVSRVGLREYIDEYLHLLKRHRPYHESDHVLNLAYNIVCGGHCLEDLERLRQDIAYMDALGARRIPDPTTAGDFLRRFASDDVITLMEAINEARARVWRLQPREDRQLALIDVDGTIAETLGRCKEGIALSYDGRWGYHPLLISLANSREVLYTINRPGNRPSHDGCVEWLDKSAAWAVDQADFDRVRFRGDTDFSLTVNFDRWTADGIEFVFGIDSHPSFVRRAQALDEKALDEKALDEKALDEGLATGEPPVEEVWELLERPANPPPQRRRSPDVKAQVVEEKEYRNLTLEEEHVAEMPYTPSKSKGEYRLIVLRKRVRVEKGQLRLQDEIRYLFYVTNVPASELSTAAVVLESNARCNQENLIEQLKNGVCGTHFPVREFIGNWAYLVIASLAWNLKVWSGLLLPAELGARALLRMEFRRFVDEIIKLPTQILHKGHRLLFRLLGVNRWSELVMVGTARLKYFSSG